MFKIVRKLKMLKKALKKLNADHFSNIVTEANMDRVTLKEVRERLQRDPTNRELQLEEANMYAKFRKSSYMVEVYLQQKSKATWLRLGDENTKYFHSVIKHKRLQQTTTQLKDEQGIWQNDPTVIANMLVDCYTDLLGTRGNSSVRLCTSIIQNGPLLSIPQQVELIRPFNGKDVNEAMFNIDSNKSPGPDGYGSGFFKATWSIRRGSH